MRLQGTIYCDGPECDVHHDLGVTRFDGQGQLDNLPPGFLRVSSWNEQGQMEDEIFCGTECLMKWAAKFPPPEIIEA